MFSYRVSESWRKGPKLDSLDVLTSSDSSLRSQFRAPVVKHGKDGSVEPDQGKLTKYREDKENNVYSG